jgi:hypothetical protein
VLTGEIRGFMMDAEWFAHGWVYWRLCVAMDNLGLEFPDVVLLEEYWDTHEK